VIKGCSALVFAIAFIAGCGSPVDPPPSATPGTTTPPPNATPILVTPSPSPSPTPTTAPGLTATDWGTIWDALPPGFPRYPGSEPTETGEGAASAVLDVPADVQTVTTWLQAALEQAGFSTFTLSGPAEDGSMEIESVGPVDECRVRTTIAPLGGSTIVTILYGGSCPPT
jgi:hypothetical protein